MMLPATLTVLDSSAFWNTIASFAGTIAVWAQGHVSQPPADPIADLTDRLRNPRRRALWAMRHPVRAWRNR